LGAPDTPILQLTGLRPKEAATLAQLNAVVAQRQSPHWQNIAYVN
jgi:hypothetical protein